ncbi:Auxin transporter-like protein 3 [Hibiscus syriacus]|uniref:Auxin transporter-like protein 3 n=1 Tax=Hibiscus syriacus TaxID=106335 RepID=A0A6A3BYS0_HIBSY|nr:Auxin transporter-like protein 3 [Hibiscus syriacus]
MASEKVETVVAGNYLEMEREEGDSRSAKSKLSNFFWHGGSVYDAWFSCASNQAHFFSSCSSATYTAIFILATGDVIRDLISTFLWLDGKLDSWFEVLDELLGKHWRNIGLFFNCTFLLFGSVIQLIACASNIYYINDNLDKRTWTYIFGACCATTVFIPSFHNYRIWSFLGLMMTSYTAWYMTIASLLHGRIDGVKHSGPTKVVLYFTGATNILYTFGGHAVTVEIMHAMWKPQKFKMIYLLATLYVLTLTLPSASAVYWAFGDLLLTHSNALSLLPRTGFRDTAVILMLIHQKFIGVHETKSVLKRAVARLPVVIPIWFLAIIFPFFGPINSTVGSLLVSFTVYIIPSLAHMITFAPASARESAVERPPSFLGGWAGMYSINIIVVIWVLIVGFGFGGWASMLNFIQQIDTFGLFTKCYQCPHKP